MKITICTERYIKLDVSDPLIEKVYNEKDLTNEECEFLKETISKLCGLPHEDNYDAEKDLERGFWTSAYVEDTTLIYE